MGEALTHPAAPLCPAQEEMLQGTGASRREHRVPNHLQHLCEVSPSASLCWQPLVQDTHGTGMGHSFGAGGEGEQPRLWLLAQSSGDSAQQ